jgi:uncharacterized repeat protein (TIGR01451 family)
MRPLSAKIAALASGLMIAAGGCTVPASRSQGGLHGPTTAAIPAAPPKSAAPRSEQIAQVGYDVPVASSQCHSGCGSACGSSATGCSSAPHGYAMPCNVCWNAYGIDPQEFLCDGGDHPPAARVRRDDSIDGLQAEDTVVHYTTEAGDIELQASNRVCLYAPRFSSVRKITGAVAGDQAIGLAQFDRPQGTIRMDSQLPGLVMADSTQLAYADVARPIDALRERIRGVPVEAIEQPLLAADVLEALAALSLADLQLLRDEDKAVLQKLTLAAVTWELDESLEVLIEDILPPTLIRDEQLQALTIYEFPNAGRLQICKLADRSDAQPGELVNFAITVQNVGDSPVDHVVLVDHLTTRLEYVEGSQTCSGGAEFEAVANEGQSLELRWKLTDKLRVGESITIRFQCKVR